MKRMLGFLLLLAFLGSAIFSLGVGAKKATADTSSPNVVLILTDDQRWDALDRMPKVQSNITDHGIKFTNAIVDNPWCCPSRASILTGQRSHTTQVWSNVPPYGGFESFKDTSTIATWLHDAGYRTGLVGKYLNDYEKYPKYVPPGWDIWRALTYHTYKFTDYKVSENGVQRYYGNTTAAYKTDVLANYADKFIRGTPSGQPLFLYLAPNAPHLPATPAAKYATTNLDLPTFNPPSYNEADVSDKPAYIQKLPMFTTDAPGNFRLKQYRSLLSVDDMVGKVVQALSDTGRLHNTIIMFASDNGYEWGEHRWLGKVTPYIESLRIPFIVRYDPITTTAGVDGHLVSNIDFAPTIADLAGVLAPGAEGQSVRPFLSGGDDPLWRTHNLIEHVTGGATATEGQSTPTYCGLHSNQWTYVEYATGERELYDEQADPYELNNVAYDPIYQTVVFDMHAQLEQECQPLPPGMTLNPVPTPAPTSTPTPTESPSVSPTQADTPSPTSTP